MKNIIIIGVISGLLIITGLACLISIKKQNLDVTTKTLIIDFENYCDEAIYPHVGSSEELDEVLSGKAKKEEPFLVINDKETIHSILRPVHVSQTEIAHLERALKPYLWVTDLAPGDLYRFKLKKTAEGNVVSEFVIQKVDPYRVPVLYSAKRESQKPASTQFTVEISKPPITEELTVIELSVKGTLYQTFNQLPFGNELMQRFMSVFAWQMRLPKDVLAGDKITILTVKKYIQDEFIGFGSIKRVYYRQHNRSLIATYFVSSDKKIQGFFDDNGHSLEKEFAYSPVYEATATSHQKWRLHPIRKIRIRHNGIDYRGSIGTEFYSIADGEVIEKRYDRNVGNMIRIRHKYGVHSEYFHAHTLAHDLKVGERVKRGQLLGTIGRTGRLCTGPHLHMGLYTMQKDKRKYIELSSLRITLKNASNLSGSYVTEFQEHKKNLLAIMQKEDVSKVADSSVSH